MKIINFGLPDVNFTTVQKLSPNALLHDFGLNLCQGIINMESELQKPEDITERLPKVMWDTGANRSNVMILSHI